MAAGTITIPYNEDYSLMIYQNDILTNDTYYFADIRYSNGILIGSTDTYTGEFNTTLIVDISGVTVTAAKYCNDLVLGGYNDWYLPSTEEMTAINNAGFLISTPTELWTSLEHDESSAFVFNTSTGAYTITFKSSFRSSIPVRKSYLTDAITIERMSLSSIDAPILNGGVNNADEDVYKMLGGINGISKNSKIMTNE
jgi:hypothetical protein